MIDSPRDQGAEESPVVRRAAEPAASGGGAGDGASLAPVLAPLVEALVSAGHEHLESMSQLRSTVCAYVTALLRQGFSSPEIVATVRAVVGDLRAAGTMPQVSGAGGDSMLDQVVAWCVEFGTPEQRDD